MGDGWAAAGDAAIFVDPILSSGVTLAMQSGHRAAYTFKTARARKHLPERSLWQAYADYIRGEYGAFLTMARHFYGNNKAAKSWWWESQSVVNRAGRLEHDDHPSFTMATAGFCPVPGTNPSAVVGSRGNHRSGPKADLLNFQRETRVPEVDTLARCDYSVLAPFRLDLRAEPVMTGGAQGVLDVYHDLVTDSFNLAHRLAAAPCRINPVMSPVVDAMGRHRRAPDLLDEAPRLLPPSYGIDRVRHSTLEILRAAAMKGFVSVR